MDVWDLRETLKPCPLREGTLFGLHSVVGSFLGWRREAEFLERRVVSGALQGSDCSHCKRQRSRKSRDVQSRQVHEDLKLSVSHKTSRGVAHFNVPRCHRLMSLPSE